MYSSQKTFAEIARPPERQSCHGMAQYTSRRLGIDAAGACLRSEREARVV